MAKKANKKVRVAIIGVGNCAAALVQGVHYYKDAADNAEIPGLMHASLGGYHVRDIEFSAAFDVVEGKVGKDLSEAMWAAPNNTIKFAEVPFLNVPVSRGMTHDGLGKYVSTMVKKAPGSTDDVIAILKDTRTDVVVNFMPVGSEMATKWYVEQVLEAGCGFVHDEQGGVSQQCLRDAEALLHAARIGSEAAFALVVQVHLVQQRFDRFFPLFVLVQAFEQGNVV